MSRNLFAARNPIADIADAKRYAAKLKQEYGITVATANDPSEGTTRDHHNQMNIIVLAYAWMSGQPHLATNVIANAEHYGYAEEVIKYAKQITGEDQALATMATDSFVPFNAENFDSMFA